MAPEPAHYLIFSQCELEPSSLIRAAQRLGPSLRPHTLELEVGGFKPGEAGVSARLMLRASLGPLRRNFELTQRKPNSADQAAAERAEQSGRAYGMSQLSARCPWLWQLGSLPDEAPSDSAPEAGSTLDPRSGDQPGQVGSTLTLVLCALLAGVALGPVMPPAQDTLFGVRGARERAGV